MNGPERARRPHEIVVDHYHRHVRLGQRVEILLDPRRVAIGQRAEALQIGAGGQQQHVPAEQADEAGDQRHVDAGHVDAERVRLAVCAVVRFKATDQLAPVLCAEPLPRIEAQHVLGGLVRTEDRVAAVHPAGRILGMAHVGLPRPELVVADQGAPEEIVVPGPHESDLRPLFDLVRAVDPHLDAGPRMKAICARCLTSSGLLIPTSMPVTASIRSQCMVAEYSVRGMRFGISRLSAAQPSS